MKSSEADMWQV